MNLKTRIGVGALATIAILSTVACGTFTQIIGNLGSIVNLVDSALNTIEKYYPTSTPAITQAEAWLAVVAKDASDSVVESESSDTTQLKYDKTAQIWVNSALPNIPNLPPVVGPLLVLVETSVTVYLTSMDMTPATASDRASIHPHELPADQGSRIVKPNLIEHFHLSRIKRHADALVKKLGK